jgi:hypothetical protein
MAKKPAIKKAKPVDDSEELVIAELHLTRGDVRAIRSNTDGKSLVQLADEHGIAVSLANQIATGMMFSDVE